MSFTCGQLWIKLVSRIELPSFIQGSDGLQDNARFRCGLELKLLPRLDRYTLLFVQFRLV